MPTTVDLSRAALSAHEDLRTLRSVASSRTACPEFYNGTPPAGRAEGTIAGIGTVVIECRKELVERRRGLKIRHRFTFAINGARVTEKSVYEKARAL